jgi:hypothetical protein
MENARILALLVISDQDKNAYLAEPTALSVNLPTNAKSVLLPTSTSTANAFQIALLDMFSTERTSVTDARKDNAKSAYKISLLAKNVPLLPFYSRGLAITTAPMELPLSMDNVLLARLDANFALLKNATNAQLDLNLEEMNASRNADLDSLLKETNAFLAMTQDALHVTQLINVLTAKSPSSSISMDPAQSTVKTEHTKTL